MRLYFPNPDLATAFLERVDYCTSYPTVRVVVNGRRDGRVIVSLHGMPAHLAAEVQAIAEGRQP